MTPSQGARELARQGKMGVVVPESALKLTEAYEMRVYWVHAASLDAFSAQMPSLTPSLVTPALLGVLLSV